MRIVLSTVPEDPAPALARRLVDERLAACVNLIPAVRSIYRWQGQVEDGRETLLVMKTADGTVARLMARIKELHPYQVPEIVVLPVEAAFPLYARWVDDETTA